MPRQAARIVGHLKADIRHMKVENPDFSRDHVEGKLGNYRYVMAAVNVRESAVSILYSRGRLSDHHVRAADRFRALWEAMGGSGAGAMDYTREPVDGGGARDPISIRQMQSGQELAKCRAFLGHRGYGLVSKVCGEGMSLSEVFSTKREKLAAADNLRAHLDDLSTMWGFATRR